MVGSPAMWTLVHSAFFAAAAAIDVPVTFYTGYECKTVSTTAANISLPLDVCAVTLGAVSFHFDAIPCAGGGVVNPYAFSDTACGQVSGDASGDPFDSECFTADSADNSLAAIQLSCNSVTPAPPSSTTTISVAPVAADPTAPATGTGAQSSASSSGGGNGQSISNGWNALGLGAHIGIIVGAAVVVLALLGCLLWRWRGKNRVRPGASPDRNRRMPEKGSDGPIAPPSPKEAYVILLDNVLNAARYHADSGVFDMDRERWMADIGDNPLPSFIMDAALGADAREARMKMGAAGELYVFTYLSRLLSRLHNPNVGLPSFGIANWTSHIRDRVNVHPDFETLQKSYGDLEGNIEYRDQSGELTRLLISKNYLREGTLQNGITYHIEVTSTLSTDSKTPFYLTYKQRQDIREVRQGHVYLICRVYGLGQGKRTRLRVFSDFEALVGNRMLVLERDDRDHSRDTYGRSGWKVTPTH